MNEYAWILIVLWLGLLILSQFLRSSKTNQGAMMAFSSVMGFALTLEMLKLKYTVVGLVLIFLNLYVLYEAVTNW